MAHRSPVSVRFGPRRLAHANIFVSSLERSVPFYRDVCGFDEVFQEPGIKAVFFSNGSCHHDIALMEIDTGDRIGRDGHLQVSSARGGAPGLNHLGFEMENERVLVEAYQRALSLGVKVHRTTDHGMSHSIYLFDPEGNLLEFYSDAVEDWRAFYRANENQLISANWNPLAAEASSRPLYHESFDVVSVPGAVMHPRLLTEAHLRVRDLAQMRAFYEEVAGLEVLEEDGDPGRVVLVGALGEPTVVLQQANAGLESGLHHIGFGMTPGSDLAAAARALEDRGVEIEASDSVSALVVSDPDGLRLVFYAAPAQARVPAAPRRGATRPHPA